MNIAPEFALFRRFRFLHARLLLYKQDELAELETKLINLDNEEQVPYHLYSRRSNPSVFQKSLISEIETGLKKYSKSPSLSMRGAKHLIEVRGELLDAYYREREKPAPDE
jgi:hypothetical protein